MRRKIYSMSMCPFCGTVYDESEYTRCPKCKGRAPFKMIFYK